jgi:hypothetical protein
MPSTQVIFNYQRHDAVGQEESGANQSPQSRRSHASASNVLLQRGKERD